MKLLVLLSLGSLLLLIGCSSASSDASASIVAKGKPTVAETEQEKAYREKFVQISRELEAIKKPEESDDPEKFLAEMKAGHEKLRDVITELSEVNPPPKFKEFHQTLVDWKKERWALDEEGIGYLTDKDFDKVDELSKRIDEVGETYTRKLDEIVRAKGYDSTEKFLGIR